MPESSIGTRVGALLVHVNRGNQQAWGELLNICYGELRAMARRIRGDRNMTVQATELLNEVMLSLGSSLEKMNFENPTKFYALVSVKLRRRLIDHIRSREAQIRKPRNAVVSLDETIDVATRTSPSALIDLHEALEWIAGQDPELGMIVDAKMAGATTEEVAADLGMGKSTVEAKWAFAKATLRQRLESKNEP